MVKMCTNLKKGFDFLNHRSETEVRVFFKRGKKQVFVKNFSEFKKVVDEFNGKYPIYFGVNERKPFGTKSEDVKTLSMVVTDIDSKHPKGKGVEQCATDKELSYAIRAGELIRDWFVSQGFEEPALVKSGNGCYLWYALPPYEITKDNFEKISKKLKAFQHFVINKFVKGLNVKGEKQLPYLPKDVVDNIVIDSIGDLSRIIRVPGTMNVKGDGKGKRPHRMCEFLGDGVRRDDHRLLRFIMGLPIEKRRKINIKVVEQDEDIKHRLDLVKKDSKLMNLLNGYFNGFKSRSEREMAIVNSLVFYELPFEVIDAIISKIKGSKWNEASEDYRQLTYLRAKEFVRKTYSQIPSSMYPKEDDVVYDNDKFY